MACWGRTGVLFEGLLARPKIDVGLVVVCGVTVGRGIGGLVRIGGGGTVAFVFAVEFPAPTRFQPVTPPGPDQEICGTSGRRACHLAASSARLISAIDGRSAVLRALSARMSNPATSPVAPPRTRRSDSPHRVSVRFARIPVRQRATRSATR